MNYYRHHIGDYLRDTAHLSLIEDAVYRRLLDLYYMRETPLPADGKVCARLVRARSADEVGAVETVLAEFFVLGADGWRQKRADLEIASAFEAAERARANGKRGGMAPGSKSRPRANPQVTQPVSSGLPEETQSEPKANPDESSPPSTLHPPYITPAVPLAGDANNTRKRRLPNDFVLTTELADAALACWAKAGRTDLDPADQFEKFRTHHTANGNRMADWSAAWRTWYGNALTFTKPSPPRAVAGKEWAV